MAGGITEDDGVNKDKDEKEDSDKVAVGAACEDEGVDVLWAGRKDEAGRDMGIVVLSFVDCLGGTVTIVVGVRV